MSKTIGLQSYKYHKSIQVMQNKHGTKMCLQKAQKEMKTTTCKYK